MLSREFLTGFKRETEEKWRDQIIDPLIHGFQFQAGTRWRSGLSDEQILAYEDEIGIRFPSDLRAFLGEMNGTDLVTINIFGSSGEASREGLVCTRTHETLSQSGIALRMRSATRRCSL